MFICPCAAFKQTMPGCIAVRPTRVLKCAESFVTITQSLSIAYCTSCQS